MNEFDPDWITFDHSLSMTEPGHDERVREIVEALPPYFEEYRDFTSQFEPVLLVDRTDVLRSMTDLVEKLADLDVEPNGEGIRIYTFTEGDCS